VADFVLHPPRKEETEAIGDALEQALTVVGPLVRGDFAGAMHRLHTKEKDT
jgi:PTH1 family peptidyl-tRNA hydrolase